jgi:hypothetical protein
MKAKKYWERVTSPRNNCAVITIGRCDQVTIDAGDFLGGGAIGGVAFYAMEIVAPDPPNTLDGPSEIKLEMLAENLERILPVIIGLAPIGLPLPPDALRLANELGELRVTQDPGYEAPEQNWFTPPGKPLRALERRLAQRPGCVGPIPPVLLLINELVLLAEPHDDPVDHGLALSGTARLEWRLLRHRPPAIDTTLPVLVFASGADVQNTLQASISLRRLVNMSPRR